MTALFAATFVAARYIFGRKNSRHQTFWKAAADNPAEAMMFFMLSSAWFVDKKPAGIDVSGPYIFVDPWSGNPHKIYAQSDVIEETQESFLHDMQSGFSKLKELATGKDLDREIQRFFS